MIRSKLIARTVCLLLAAAGTASAEGPRVHAAGGAAHAAGNAQGREFGWGGNASLGVEVPVARAIGLQVEGSLATLAKGQSPTDPSIADHGAGSLATGTAGAVVHPFGDGPYLAAGAGGAATGGLLRPAMAARIGWDIPIGDGHWALGPTAGYTHVFQPDSQLRPDDARIVWAGLQISFGGSRAPSKSSPAPAERAAIARRPAALPAPIVQDEPDGDGDGIPDVRDACPTVFGASTGDPANDGCPAPPRVQVVGDRVAVSERIEFAFDSDELDASALKILGEIAVYVRQNPEIVAMQIEGHADEIGTEQYNDRLSRHRAEAVCRFLAEQLPGVRLTARGYGKRRPLSTAGGDVDRQKNRRVEFVVKRAEEGHGAGGHVASRTEAGR